MTRSASARGSSRSSRRSSPRSPRRGVATVAAADRRGARLPRDGRRRQRHARGDHRPGLDVLVVSRGDDALDGAGRSERAHFPQDAGRQVGRLPPRRQRGGDPPLEALRERRAPLLRAPGSSFWWLHHYGGLAEHLEASYRRIHSGEHLVVFDLGDAEPAESAAGHARGGCSCSGPAKAPGRGPRRDRGRARSAPGATRSRSVEPEYRGGRAPPAWRRADAADPEPTGRCSSATRPCAAASSTTSCGWRRLADTAGVERVQPTHASGPEAGPPVTERLRGVLAREVEAVTPLPVLAVRGGARARGPWS